MNFTAAGARPWPRRRWAVLIALVFAAHVGLIAAFSDRSAIYPRQPTRVPRVQLTAGLSEWLALNDPTLFALPHRQGFTGPAWEQFPQVEVLTRPNSVTLVWPAWEEFPRVEVPVLVWSEPLRWLALPVEQLGQDFAHFMRTNRFAGLQLEMNPLPALTTPALEPEPAVAAESTLRIEGDLAGRRLLNPPELPSWTNADFIAPSVVQVLVNAAGDVVSAVLLLPDIPAAAPPQLDAANRRALELAKAARFERMPREAVDGAPNPAVGLTWGRMIFRWCLAPLSVTNGPASSPP